MGAVRLNHPKVLAAIDAPINISKKIVFSFVFVPIDLWNKVPGFVVTLHSSYEFENFFMYFV